MLLPGTDESCFDCEFLQQLDGRQSWIELSDREGFLVAICQSRGLHADPSYPGSWRPTGDAVRALWLPKHTDPEERDMRYVEAVVDDIEASLRAAGSAVGHVLVVGFSNGGFMAADFALALSAAATRQHTASRSVGVQVRTLVGPDWRDLRVLPLIAPWSVCWDSDRPSLLCTDGAQVKRVDPNTGAVSVVAGQRDAAGFADGALTDALFGFPLQGVVHDARSSRVIVADSNNDAIRVISERANTVSTLCVLPEPRGLALDVASSTLYVSTGLPGSLTHNRIWSLNLAVNNPTPTVFVGAGPPGARDGPADVASFCNPEGLLLLDGGRSLLVCDAGNDSLRLVDTRTRAARTWGGRSGSPDCVDGPHHLARFRLPTSAALMPDGRVLVCDSGNARLRVLSDALGHSARVETLLGAGGAGFADGTAAKAKFREAFDAAVLPDGRVAVCDPYNHRIRTLQLNAPLAPPLGSRPRCRFGVAAVVCYMGGIDESQLALTAGLHPQEVQTDETALAIPSTGSLVLTCAGAASQESAHRPDVLVVTGTRDMQVFSSQRAWDAFRALGCSVELEIIAGAAHEYASGSTERIWEHFKRTMLHKATAFAE